MDLDRQKFEQLNAVPKTVSENAMKRLLQQSFKLRQYNVRALVIRTGVLGVPYYDCSIM